MSYGDTPPPPPPPPTGGGASKWPSWAPIAVVGIAAVLIGIGIAVFSGGDERTPATTGALTTSTADSQGATTQPPPSTTTSTAAVTTTTSMPSALEPGGSWTVMLYMLGDNNLEPAIFPDLEELSFLPESDDVRVLALIDRHEEYTDREIFNLPNWTGAKLVELDGTRLSELADHGEVDMGDPAVLEDFLVTAIRTAPADHYALVLWDHGAITGVGDDDSSGDGLNPFEIGDALEAALVETEVPMLDIIGFDACMMGAYEVATAVAPYAYYMIGSEENEPNGGWNYEAFDYIARNPDGTAEGLGREIIDRFLAREAEGTPRVTLSLIELTDLDGFHRALGDFAGVAAQAMDEYAASIGRERLNAISFAGNPDPEKDWHMTDLDDFFARLAAAEPDLGRAIEVVRTALADVVVYSGTGSVHAGAGGLSVYFPPRGEYWVEGLAPVIPEPWLEFVQAFYRAGDAIPEEDHPDIVQAENQADFEMTDDSLILETEFNVAAEANAIEVVLYNGIPEPDGSAYYYGETQGILEGTTAAGLYDLTLLVLSDGEDSAIAYQDISFNEDLTYFTLDVPVAYFPPGSNEWIDAVISFGYDTVTDTFSQTTLYQIDPDGYWGPILPEPNGLIAPWLPHEYPDGRLVWETDEVRLWADLDELTWDWIDLEPGTLVYAELWVCDYGGNCDWAWAEAVVGSGASGGGDAGGRATCRNNQYGYEFQYPASLYLFETDDADFECSLFHPQPFAAADLDAAWEEAAFTVEYLGGNNLENAAGFLRERSEVWRNIDVPGIDYPVIEFEDQTPGQELSGYIIPTATGQYPPSFVIISWTFIAPEANLPAAADMVLDTIAM